MTTNTDDDNKEKPSRRRRIVTRNDDIASKRQDEVQRPPERRSTLPRAMTLTGNRFPIGDPRVCLIEITIAGKGDSTSEVRDVGPRTVDRVAAVERAIAKSSLLFAVWPGHHRSDLFIIDDPDMAYRMLRTEQNTE